MDNQRLIYKITQALLEIEKSEGVKINFGFSTDFTGVQLSGHIQDKVSIERENALNLSACRRIGFTQNIVDQSFTSFISGGQFRIKGIQPRNRKYPVIAENLSNGKSYKFSVDHVKKAFGGDQLINRFSNLEKLTENEE